MPRKVLDGPERPTLLAAGGGLDFEPTPDCPTASAGLGAEPPMLFGHLANKKPACVGKRVCRNSMLKCYM